MTISAETFERFLMDPAIPWIPSVASNGRHSVLVADLIRSLEETGEVVTQDQLDALVIALGGRRLDVEATRLRIWRRSPPKQLTVYELPAGVKTSSYKERIKARKVSD